MKELKNSFLIITIIIVIATFSNIYEYYNEVQVIKVNSPNNRYEKDSIE